MGRSACPACVPCNNWSLLTFAVQETGLKLRFDGFADVVPRLAAIVAGGLAELTLQQVEERCVHTCDSGRAGA